jgi:ABC-type polysaccharide/polyol phosphate transport system ATPase subunit
MPDGETVYPEEKHADQKGMSIEFKFVLFHPHVLLHLFNRVSRSVGFAYPRTEKDVLKNMSFHIEAGQLCVIVGENGAPINAPMHVNY